MSENDGVPVYYICKKQKFAHKFTKTYKKINHMFLLC